MCVINLAVGNDDTSSVAVLDLISNIMYVWCNTPGREEALTVVIYDELANHVCGCIIVNVKPQCLVY
jgi:hypothetical protein